MITKDKKINMLIVAIIAIVLIQIIALFTTSKGITFADTQSMYEDKIYSNFTLEDNFDDSCVIVVMDKAVGGINKEHDIAFFGNAYLAPASTFAN